jgi:hypothetical protein
VSKLSTFRILLAFASQHNWKIDLLDVVTDFLNPKIDKDDVFTELPECNKIVRLKKAPYGLRQALRVAPERGTFLSSLGI